MKLLTAKEMNDKIQSVASKRFGGRWKINEQNDRSKISTHLNNINGIVKTKLDYHKDSNTFPTLRLDSTLHDGEYRDQVIYLKVAFDETVMKQNENTIIISHKNASVEVSYGRLYSIAQDHNCMADIEANFTFALNSHIKSTIVLSSDGS